MTTPITHIYFLLDRSGSMESMRDDVIGGFNAFLREQVADGRDAVMTLVQFDSGNSHEVLVDAAPLETVSPLTRGTFEPRGGTPLFDAMGTLIIEASRRAEVEDGRETVIFVTFTDGEENASSEFSKDKVFLLVDERTKKGWTFVYLGANQDSYREGGRVGFSADSI
jgi:Mg-chelatase subunit ChlD